MESSCIIISMYMFLFIYCDFFNNLNNLDPLLPIKGLKFRSSSIFASVMHWLRFKLETTLKQVWHTNHYATNTYLKKIWRNILID